MTESKEKSGGKLKLSGSKTLSLKKNVDAGQVRQSLSHGRGKSVVVERKRRRMVARDSDAKPAETEALVEDVAEEVSDSHLTDEERAVRARVLEEAQKQAEIDKAKAEEEAKLAAERAKQEAEAAKAAEEARAKEEKEAATAPAAETAKAPAADKAAEEPKADAVEKPKAKPAAKKADAASPSTPAAKTEARPPRGREAEEEDEAPRKAKAVERPRHRLTTRSEPRRRERPLTVQRALDDEAEERQRSLAAMRRAREKQKAALKDSNEPLKKIVRDVVVPESITVADLANRMAERAADVIRELMKMGVMATVNDVIDTDTAELVVTEMGHNIRRVSEADVEIGLSGDDDDDKDLKPRAPVVTVMGHVDHGKTSLLDAMRQSDVVAGEAGGITQHIGAYQVAVGDSKITFLDTPGHAAFTAMRARGAKVTDLVVLVVAADDSIMPQTIEAIQHAKAAEVPIIVAINKMDLPDANADRVRQELLQHEIVVEGMGGDVLDVEVSATKKTNLDKLEEAIVLQSELMELKANPDRPAEGIVIESALDKGRGSVATVLVTRGTARVGDIFVAGAEWGRIRALIDDKGNQIKEAGPSQPVEILGLNGTPTAGDDFSVVENEARAREVSEYRQRQLQEQRSAPMARASLETMLDKLKTDQVQEMPIVIKADVHGSAEAIVGALEGLNTDEVAVKVLLSGVGGVSESDITLAEASGAPILAFNVRAAGKSRTLAEQQGVEIRYYSVIYDLVDDIKAVLSGMLAPEINETVLGLAEVKEVFNAGKGKAAGCIVVDGVVRANAKARLLRDDVVVHSGEINAVRRFKDEVKEVNAGTECGITLEGYNDIKAGDVIEVFEVEEKARTL